MDNNRIRIEKLIKDMENEKQNSKSPFLSGQIKYINIFLSFLLNNNIIEEKYFEYVLCEIKTIMHWAVDSWPSENEIANELIEIICNYRKLIEHKIKHK